MTAAAEVVIAARRATMEAAHALAVQYEGKEADATTAWRSVAEAEELFGDACMLVFKASLRHGDVDPDVVNVDVDWAALPAQARDAVQGGLSLLKSMRQLAAVHYSKAGR